MKRKSSRRRFRTFCAAFMLTLCLLLLGCGFLVVEYNTRRTAFGDTRLHPTVEMQDGRLMARTADDETAPALPEWAENVVGRAWTLVPARIRAAAWLNEAEQAAAPPLLAWLLGVETEDPPG